MGHRTALSDAHHSVTVKDPARYLGEVLGALKRERPDEVPTAGRARQLGDLATSQRR